MATTLTREQRIEAYTYALFCALDRLSNHKQNTGCCFIFDNWFDNEALGRVVKISELSEFVKQRPESVGFYWFESQQDRISALCRAIEQCEKSKV